MDHIFFFFFFFFFFWIISFALSLFKYSYVDDVCTTHPFVGDCMRRQLSAGSADRPFRVQSQDGLCGQGWECTFVDGSCRVESCLLACSSGVVYVDAFVDGLCASCVNGCVGCA